MKDRHIFYQGERGDTLPDPGAERRANGDLKGQEMRSRNDGAKRAVIYVRVANAENGSQHSIERQAVACREVAERLGLDIIGEYRDIGGAKRQELRRMLGELDCAKPSYVIALDSSRFGRRVNENLAVRAWLAAADVEPVFVQGSGRDPRAWPWQFQGDPLEISAASEAMPL